MLYSSSCVISPLGVGTSVIDAEAYYAPMEVQIGTVSWGARWVGLKAILGIKTQYCFANARRYTSIKSRAKCNTSLPGTANCICASTPDIGFQRVCLQIVCVAIRFAANGCCFNICRSARNVCERIVVHVIRAWYRCELAD